LKKRLLLLTALLINITVLFFNQKATGQVVFTSLQGNSPVYTKGVNNAVVYGFSVTVPAFTYFSGGPLRIGVTQSLNGFTSAANLVRVASADPTLALSAPLNTYGANVNGSGDNGIAINGWPDINNFFNFTSATYYFYLVINYNSSNNTPQPTAYNFYLPSSANIVQNANNYSITVNNTNSTTYNFSAAPPAPAFSYATPQVYTTNIGITPLSPTNTGGAVGSYTGAATFATVNASNSVAVNPVNGNIYVTSTTNNAVYIYNAAGTLQTTLTGATYNFNSPDGITIDNSGNVYVGNGAGGTVKRISSTGTVTTITGFTRATGLATDAAGNLYVADFSASAIYKIAPGGTTAGAAYISVSGPWDVAINSTGDLYVTVDGPSNNINQIYKYPSGSTTPTTVVSTGLNSPRNISIDSKGNIFFADCNNGAIKLLNTSGTVSTIVSGLNTPVGITQDASGNLFYTSFNNNLVYKSTASGYSISPTLPAGLSFNNYTGVISGTPTVTSPATNYTVTATNGGGSSTAVVNITVNPPVSLSYTTPLSFTAGSAIPTQFPTTTGNPTSYSTTGLPAGLTLNTTNGQITGTPTTASAAANYSITATNSTTSATFSINITVSTATYPTGYAYKMPITLNTTGLGITGNLTDFPVLLKIVDPGLVVTTGGCSNRVQFPTGPAYDFAFVDPNSSANELPYQVESYDATNGILLVWVQIPTIYKSSNNVLNFYYGNATAPSTHTTTFYQSTWKSVNTTSSNYQGVWHFTEVPSNTTASILDATGSGNNLVASSTAVTRSNAIIQSGATLNNATLYNNAVTNFTALNTPMTMSSWVYYTTYPAYASNVMTVQNQNIGSYSQLAFRGTANGANNNAVCLNLGGGGIVVSSDVWPTTAAWHYVVYTYDGTNSTIYVDGALAKTNTTSPNTGVANTIVFGSYTPGGGEYFSGTVDESRVINTNLSADWIKAEYVNQTDPGTFTVEGTTVADPTNVKTISGGVTYTYNGTTYTPNITGPSNTPSFNGKENFVISNSTTLAAGLSMYGLTVNSGVNLGVNGQTLNVGCNIYNNGTISNTTSTISFNGTFTPQYYYGTNVAGTGQVGNIIINNTATNGQVRITGGPVDVYNTLTLTAGSLFIDNANSGALTLKSSGTFTARVAAIPAGLSVTGNVTVERWFTGGSASNRGWRLMSSPVNNSTNIQLAANSNTATTAAYNFSSLKNNLPFSGTGGATNGFDASTNNGPTVLLYNTSTFLFSSLPSLTTTVPVGSGFYFYFRGNRSSNKFTRPFPNPEANTVGQQIGYLNQQSFRYNLSNAGNGWNAVGNPYPSTIVVSSAALSPTGTTGFIYTYTSGNSVVTQLGSANIASGQGFFVRANAAGGYITFTEALKSTAQPTGATLLMGLPKATPEPLLTMRMVQDSANYDIAHLRFLDNYKPTYYDMEDADDFNGQGQTVFLSAMTSDAHKVAVASQPFDKQRTSVFLSIDDSNSGIYTLKRDTLKDIPDIYEVWLMDHFTKDSLDLRVNSTYNFNLNKNNPATFGSNRFEVVIRKRQLPPYQLISFSGTRNAKDVTLNWNTVNEYNYTSFELQRSTDGQNFQAVRDMQSTTSGTYSYKDVDALPVGNVYYRLKQVDINNKESYSNVVIINTAGNGSLSIYPNPTSNNINFSLNNTVKLPVRVRIYNSTGGLMKTAVFSTSSGQQDVSALMPGTYTIQITTEGSSDAVLTGKFIKL